MNDRVSTVAKIAAIPQILEAENVLRANGLIEETEGHFVRLFMGKNPDIQDAINGANERLLAEKRLG